MSHKKFHKLCRKYGIPHGFYEIWPTGDKKNPGETAVIDNDRVAVYFSGDPSDEELYRETAAALALAMRDRRTLDRQNMGRSGSMDVTEEHLDDVKTRLDKAAKIGGFKSRRQMAKELGISYSTLNKWVDNNRITEKGAIQIASKIPISQTYLLTGEGKVSCTNKRLPLSAGERLDCAVKAGDFKSRRDMANRKEETPKVSEMVWLFEELSDEDKRFVYKCWRRAQVSRIGTVWMLWFQDARHNQGLIQKISRKVRICRG